MQRIHLKFAYERFRIRAQNIILLGSRKGARRGIDQQIAENKLLGKTKQEVVEIFGDTDTTKTTLIYNLTFPESTNRYLLVIELENNRVIRYAKKKIKHSAYHSTQNVN